jgi:hypothetical protein
LKYVLSALLFVLSLPALANHHRAHALFFIDDLRPRIAQLASRDLPELRLVNELSDPVAEQRLREIELMVAETLVVLDELEAQLYLPSCRVAKSRAVLDVARGMANRKEKGAPGLASNGKNLAGQAGRISYRMGQFLDVVDVNEIDQAILARMLRRHADAWGVIDSIIWHVNDAFREEVDGSAGAGHDPEIDPAGFGQDYIFDACPRR